jgi:hypothetical protein
MEERPDWGMSSNQDRGTYPLPWAGGPGGWQRDEGAGRNQHGFSLREFMRRKNGKAARCRPCVHCSLGRFSLPPWLSIAGSSWPSLSQRTADHWAELEGMGERSKERRSIGVARGLAEGYASVPDLVPGKWSFYNFPNPDTCLNTHIRVVTRIASPVGCKAQGKGESK